MGAVFDLDERLLTEAEAAKVLRVSTRTLRYWRARRQISCLLLGAKTVRYRREFLADFLRAKEQPARPPRRRG